MSSKFSSPKSPGLTRANNSQPSPNGLSSSSPLGVRRPLLVFLNAMLPSFSSAERLIAEFILKDPEKVLSRSISEFRTGSGASVGSIIAFCKNCGLKGFVDFKITLAGELAQGGFSALKKAALEQEGSLFERVFEFHKQSLNETLKLNNITQLEEAVQMLERANKIEFFSIGMSYPVAYTACAKLKLIGLNAGTECDSHLQIIRATQLQKGDVAFAISCSGRTNETVRCLEIARGQKATTICLTNCVESPIIKQTDLVLLASPSEIQYFQAPLAARITQLVIIDALFVAIALNRKKQTMASLQTAGEQLLKQRL
jgi:RpiR family carbohydrate utilization transcriptional regulator